jgi:hypothetical protein
MKMLQNAMKISLKRRAQLAVQLAISRTVIDSSDWYIPVAGLSFQLP